jgi:hypothetical protein
MGPAGAPNPDAADSAALGGIPASGYVQSGCNGTGDVKGFAYIPASPSFSSTYINVNGSNCAGQDIQAKRIAAGLYEVQFLGSPVTLAVGNVVLPQNNTTAPFVASVNIEQVGPGDFKIVTWAEQDNASEDIPFDLVTP